MEFDSDNTACWKMLLFRKALVVIHYNNPWNIS